MSRLDELIQAFCPEGVEFKPLGEVIAYEQPTKYLVGSTEYSDTFPTPVLTAGQTFILGRTDETVGVYPASVASPVIIFDDFTTAFKWVDFPFKAKSSAMKMLTAKDPNVASLRYLLFAMQTVRYTPQDHARQWIGTYSDFRIPVPPLEVQLELVRVLDQFSGLIGALDSEIEKRRRQRATLAVNVAVESRDAKAGEHTATSVRLGTLAREVVAPVKVRPQDSYVNLGVKWNGEGVLMRQPRSGAEIKATTLYGVRPGQLVYNRMFVVEGSFALVPPECDGAVVSSEFPVYDINKSVVEPEWLLHYLCDPYTLARIEAEVTGTERGTMKSRRRWKQDQFARFVVEMPTLERQREILCVLRACDDLIGSLRDELAARRKQYEYYRDKLLTFEEAAS